MNEASPTTATAGGNGQSGGITEQLGRATDTAKSQTATVAHVGKEQVGEVLTRTRDEVRSAVADQSRRGAAMVEQWAGDLRQMSEVEGLSSGMAGVVSRASSEMERLARVLGDDPEQMTAQVKRFARQRPGMFLGGCLIAGMIAGRLLTDDRDLLTTGTGAGQGDGPGFGDQTIGQQGLGAVDVAPVATPPLEPAPALDLGAGSLAMTPSQTTAGEWR